MDLKLLTSLMKELEVYCDYLTDHQPDAHDNFQRAVESMETIVSLQLHDVYANAKAFLSEDFPNSELCETMEYSDFSTIISSIEFAREQTSGILSEVFGEELRNYRKLVMYESRYLQEHPEADDGKAQHVKMPKLFTDRDHWGYLCVTYSHFKQQLDSMPHSKANATTMSHTKLNVIVPS